MSGRNEEGVRRVVLRKKRRYSTEDVASPEKIAFFRSALLAWFRQHGRSFPWRTKSATRYQLVVSEILLKRTQAETVARFFPAFVRQFPSWKKLAKATEEELQQYLQPIGLWRQRATALTALAAEMSKRRGVFPRDLQGVESLPGVGQYVANAILLFCHNDPHPLIDVNMARVLERFFGPRKLVDIRDDPYLQSLSKEVMEGEEPVSLNWATLDLAALVCIKQVPKCESCPLITQCKFACESVKEGRHELRTLTLKSGATAQEV